MGPVGRGRRAGRCTCRAVGSWRRLGRPPSKQHGEEDAVDGAFDIVSGLGEDNDVAVVADALEAGQAVWSRICLRRA